MQTKRSTSRPDEFDLHAYDAVQGRTHPNIDQMAETELGLVPEIYYDVIARLCAGAPFVAVAFWAYPAMRTLSALALGLVAAFGSYLVGHLLAAISALWNPLLWNRVVLGRFIAGLKLANPFSSDSPRRVFHELYCRIDLIASRDSNGGAILKKMEAGSQLSDNLLSGFLVVVAARALYSGGLTLGETGLASALAVVLLVSVVLRRLILIGRQDSLYTLLGKETPVPKPVEKL
jgi:hypothetical protein